MSYESERKWYHLWDDVLFEGPHEGDGRKVLDHYFKKFKEVHPVSRLKRSFKEGPMSLVVRKDGRPAPVFGDVRDVKFDMKDFGELDNPNTVVLRTNDPTTIQMSKQMAALGYLLLEGPQDVVDQLYDLYEGTTWGDRVKLKRLYRDKFPLKIIVLVSRASIRSFLPLLRSLPNLADSSHFPLLSQLTLPSLPLSLSLSLFLSRPVCRTKRAIPLAWTFLIP